MTPTEDPARIGLPRIYTRPPVRKESGAETWQQLENVTREQIEMWAKTWPNARNTGCLTRLMPTLDIDILNEEAARAVEDLASERFEERGHILVRIGKPPKRAIIFRTNTPFKKITMPLIAPNGSGEEKLELLANGQQLVVDGIDPDTRQLYRWHGGEPWGIEHGELPYISAEKAQALIHDAALLCTAFGYELSALNARPYTVATPTTNGGIAPAGGEAVWKFHLENIRAGRALHYSITQLAAALIRSGMHRGAAIHLLGALTESADICHDARWEARYREIPRAVDSAVQKNR